MTGEPRLTKAQWRTVESLYNGATLYWSQSFNAYFIGVAGAEHISKRVQQITVFELKTAGIVDGLLELTPRRSHPGGWAVRREGVIMAFAKGRQARDFSYRDVLRVDFPHAVCRRRHYGSISGYCLYLHKDRREVYLSRSTAEECYMAACASMNIDIDNFKPEIQQQLRDKKTADEIRRLQPAPTV